MLLASSELAKRTSLSSLGPFIFWCEPFFELPGICHLLGDLYFYFVVVSIINLFINFCKFCSFT